MSTEERVMSLIAEQMGEGAVTRDTLFREDLGADSLDAVEIIMELEEEFDISIEDAEGDPDKFQTVGQVVDAVVAQVGEDPDADEDEDE